MGHASSIYIIRHDKDLVLRLFPGGQTDRVPIDIFEKDRGGTTFVYTYAFGQQSDRDLPSEDALRALGIALIATPRAFRESTIPAGYTYLGQLIFHDITFMAPDRTKSFRTPALDLDSVLPSPTQAAQTQPCSVGEPLPIGCTSDVVFPQDLPRVLGGADIGKPVIADPRNDDFMSLAQCHLAVLKFYNAIAHHMGQGHSEAVRVSWVKHFQSVVLHDYLPRIVDAATYQSVMQGGRKIVGVPPLDETSEWMPIEFAVACGRFGHSMIRDEYAPWNAVAGLLPTGVSRFISLSAKNSIDHLQEAGYRLPFTWITNWFRLFDFTDGPYAGTASPPIMSGRIDTAFADNLRVLPQRIRDVPLAPPGATPETFNLAVASLVRGREVWIATAQQALAAAGTALGLPLPRLTSAQLVANESAEVQQVFAAHPELLRQTPLWYYVLKEADMLAGGNKLGPLGGRIVMETLHAAIDAATDSILHEPNWRPQWPSVHPDRFTMADLIAFTGNPDPLHGWQ